MATLAELVSDIGARLGDANHVAVPAPAIISAINESIRLWQRKPLWFRENREEIVIPSGNLVIPVPSDFDYEFHANGFLISVNDRLDAIEKVPVSAFFSAFTASAGQPRIYCYAAGEYRIWPEADDDYTCIVNYYRNYATLSDDSDENEITIEGELLIKYDALSRLFAERRQDLRMSEYYQARVREQYDFLVEKNRKHVSTGCLEIEQ